MPVDAVQYRVMQDIQSSIRGAITGGTLAGGLTTGNVYLFKSINDRSLTSSAMTLPAVAIAPGPTLLPKTGLNDKDEVIYQITVALVAADNQDQFANYEQELNWVQNVRRLFHAKQLGPLTTESVVTWVRPQETVHPDAWAAQLFLSILIVQAECRETRGQG
jgi:hypothetical protein